MLERSQSTAHVGSFEVTLVDTPARTRASVRWSDETFRIFGYEPGAFAVTHATFFEFIHPDDRERVRAASPRQDPAAASRSRTNFGSCAPDGAVRDMHTWTDFERDADGQPDPHDRHLPGRHRAQARRARSCARPIAARTSSSRCCRTSCAIRWRRSSTPSRSSSAPDRARRSCDRRYQAVIARQVQHMKRLLDDLLDVSRVSQGKIELRKQPVELADAAAAGGGGQPPADDREAAAARADAGAASRCRSRPIRRASCRCSRTCSTTPRSSRRRGRAHHAVVRGRRRRRGRQGARRRRGHVAASCCARASICSRRRRAPSTAPQGGLGIGLTLVRTLVKMHGGSVQASSEGPGRGSEFVVRLPLGAAADGAGGARGRAPRPTTARGRAAARAGGRRQRRRGGRDEARAASCDGHQVTRSRTTARRARRGGGRAARRWCCSTSGCRAWTATRSRARLREAGPNGAALVARHRLRTGRRSPPLGRGRLQPSPGETGRRRPCCGRSSPRSATGCRRDALGVDLRAPLDPAQLEAKARVEPGGRAVVRIEQHVLQPVGQPRLHAGHLDAGRALAPRLLVDDQDDDADHRVALDPTAKRVPARRPPDPPPSRPCRGELSGASAQVSTSSCSFGSSLIPIARRSSASVAGLPST